MTVAESGDVVTSALSTPVCRSIRGGEVLPPLSPEPLLGVLPEVPVEDEPVVEAAGWQLQVEVVSPPLPPTTVVAAAGAVEPEDTVKATGALVTAPWLDSVGWADEP